MPRLVTNLAQIQCTFGTGPSALIATPSQSSAGAPGISLATVADAVPMANITSFKMCMSPGNPAVQAATAAKLGVFSPAPCIPNTSPPWVPAARGVFVGGKPAISELATCQCKWGGLISVVNAGQVGVQSV